MAYSLTVAGVEREVLIERLNINAPLHNKGTMSAQFLSEDGSLDINLEDEIILALDGDRLFRGEVSRCQLAGADGPGGDGNDAVIWDVIANDSSWPLDYHVTSETIPAGSTLKEALELLMPEVPELALDPSQVDGPTLPNEIVFDHTKLRDAFAQLISEAVAADTDGWFLRVTHLQVLEAIAPGDAPAPFDVVEGDGTESGDITSDDRRDDDYATRVIVEGGIVSEINRAESFTGDGVTDTFPLDFTPSHVYGYVTHAGIYETMSIAPAGGATWVFDPAANTIERVTGAPALGASVVVTFDGWKQIVGDTGETSPPGRTVVEQVDGLLSTADANAAAARLLVELSASQKTLTYPTRRHGLQVGDAQVVTTAKRKVPTPTTFYVNEIDITYDGATEGDGLLYSVTVKASQIVKGNFRATFRQWARVGGSGGSVPTPQGVAQLGPGGPDTAIQSNGAGTFYGDGKFTYDRTNKRAELDDTDGETIISGLRTGAGNFGVINKPAVVSIMNRSAVNTVALAIGNYQQGASKAMTFRQLTSGGFDIEVNDAIQCNLVNYAGAWNLQGLGLATSPGAPASSQFLENFGLNFMYGTAFAVTRITATTHTISSSDSQNNIRTIYLYDTTGDCTVSLPALADAAITGGAVNRARVFLMKNASATRTVTLDPNGGETIDGAATKALAPGEGCILIGKGSTGAGWYTI